MADGFLSRWSRLKAEARGGPDGAPAADAPATANRAPVPSRRPAAAQAASGEAVASAPAAPCADGAPLPTLEDALRLDAGSDYSAFVARGVDAAVRRVALRRLFADPHFNTMDGLDVYIGDYAAADPVAPGMLDSLRRAAGLLRDDDAPHPQHAQGRRAAAPDAIPGQTCTTTRENDEH